ncbi:helix-turn-helix domain-containing protein [Agrobacterium vitis]|uniref:helix-turn-helix domain-containing protein n=1 Tax=Agrobacterium vitis TaxID=373 RepID=UPI003B525450
MTTTQALLRPSEAAQLLAITQKQLRLLTDEGHLRWINVGLGKKRPSRRYQLDDLEAFKERRAQICQSTSARAATPTPMTSNYKIVDFRGTLEQRQSARRSGSRPSEKTPPA